MAIIKCKMCGGDIELSQDKTFGTCEFCGSTMTFPKVDDEQRAAAFNRGNHFRRIGEFDKALAVYERIVRENEEDAEAHWCCALCRFGIEYVEDPATYEWLPTCHRASFDSFLEDVDYLAALDHSDGITRRQYQKDATKIAEVQRGILATSQNTEPFDVFICYKESDENGNRTRDSLLAQDIYYQLTEQGRKVFFSRITLEDMVGTQYEPYIFAALNSAKVMIVVGTKAEYMNAVWVKNEWSRFLAMMKKDRSKVLLPCYRDMDPYDMPEQLGVLQSYDMAKIGFIQDLTRGIAKVLDVDKKPEPVRESVVVQQVANSNVSALLKRGNMALEDGEWDKADSFFEEVLNQDAECVDAYLGKTLAQLRLHKPEQLCRSTKEFKNNHNYQKAIRFASPDQAKQLQDYMRQNMQFLISSGNEALQNCEWDKANTFFDEVLRQDAECAEAYLGKLLGQLQAPTLTDFVEQQVASLQANVVPQYINIPVSYDIPLEQFVVPIYLTIDDIRKKLPATIRAKSNAPYWTDRVAEIHAFVEKNPRLLQVLSVADEALKNTVNAAMDQLCQRVKAALAEAEQQDKENPAVLNLKKQAKESAITDLARQREQAAARCEEKYQELCKKLDSSIDIWTLRSLENEFFQFSDYKDSREKVNEVRQRIQAETRRSQQRQEQNRQASIWMTLGRCKHCGGEFKGMFGKKCVKCGEPKDY